MDRFHYQAWFWLYFAWYWLRRILFPWYFCSSRIFSSCLFVFSFEIYFESLLLVLLYHGFSRKAKITVTYFWPFLFQKLVENKKFNDQYHKKQTRDIKPKIIRINYRGGIHWTQSSLSAWYPSIWMVVSWAPYWFLSMVVVSRRTSWAFWVEGSISRWTDMAILSMVRAQILRSWTFLTPAIFSRESRTVRKSILDGRPKRMFLDWMDTLDTFSRE